MDKKDSERKESSGDCGDKVQELENQLKRALADYQNLKKRTDKEKQAVVKFANEVLLLKILGVLEGFEMVFNQLKELLAQEGFERVEVGAGDEFNPELMEAVEGEGKKVKQVLSAAYKLYGKIVRPARVRVHAENSKR